MKILMLTQFYAPVIGGEERIIQDLCAELTKRGHNVAVATLWRQGLPEFEIDQGIRIYRIRSTTQRIKGLYVDNQRNHIPPFPDPEVVYALMKVILREKPQIVHSHNWLVRSFLPIKRWSHAHLVMTLHDYSLSCAKKRLMYMGKPCNGPALLKCVSCSAEHYGKLKGTIVAVANWWMGKLERRLVDMYLPIGKAVLDGNQLQMGKPSVRLIPNFIRDELVNLPVHDNLCLAQLPSSGYLLFVGDLLEEKGINVLLQAYRDLVSAPPLVLIGRKFPNLPANLPPNVFALGIWDHDSVMEAWRRCSIGLTPSIWPEPFGLVAIEAMASGRPVIASRSGGLCDFIVDGETGYLIPPGDHVALKLAIEHLLAQPQLREEMGRAAKKRSKEFQASLVVPRIEQAYRSVLENRPR